MKKRIFTVLLAAAMTVSLAACAGTAENNAGKKNRGDISRPKRVKGDRGK